MPHYINNKQFEKLIKEYTKGKKKNERELFELFDLLISNIIDSFHFSVDKDDAKQECFLLILKTLKNFKSSNGSAFNYFTTIILNNLKLIFSKSKKYNEKLNEYSERRFGVYKPQSPSSL